MAGMLSAEQVDPNAAEDPTVVADEEGQEAVTPEEQAQYDQFVKLGMSLVGDKGEDILDLLDEDPTDLREILGDTELLQEPTPAVALAATTVIVVLEAINRSPERPSDDVIMHGGKELLEIIADLGADAGVHDYSQEEMNQAWLHGQDLYREAATSEGLVDQDAVKAQFDDIVTADKEGRLNEVVPGLADAEVEQGQQVEEAEEEDGRVR